MTNPFSLWPLKLFVLYCQHTPSHLKNVEHHFQPLLSRGSHEGLRSTDTRFPQRFENRVSVERRKDTKPIDRHMCFCAWLKITTMHPAQCSTQTVDMLLYATVVFHRNQQTLMCILWAIMFANHDAGIVFSIYVQQKRVVQSSRKHTHLTGNFTCGERAQPSVSVCACRFVR